MSTASRVQFAYLAYFSKPKAERRLYREIRRRCAARIVEIGIGSLKRSLRMIAVAQRYAGGQLVSYTGIDLFESRGDNTAELTLKSAYRQLRQSGAIVRLVPGQADVALARTANSLPKTDLLLIAADQDPQSLELSWFYVPRMLHPNSLVLREAMTENGPTLDSIEPGEITKFAQAQGRLRRRAA